MVLNTLTASTAVTPTVIHTYISHYLNRKPLRHKPTAHLSYHEGLLLIRRFLDYASHHTVEELQAFTAQSVPCPRWVRVEQVTIPEEVIDQAATALIAQLGHRGIANVGGEKWWQWRKEGSQLQAEWIEMRKDHAKRKRSGAKSNRVMLYVHGGAYFFGSVDEHRYQMQRHARKIEAKVFAPRYRLAPQYPFPCGLHDCLAAYLYLLTVHSPNQIILAGDSAGGGILVSVLVILRDQGLQLPAGAILISPWVDLSHSFPSVAGDAFHDYIPSHGFMQRPSASWPPPTAEDIERTAQGAIEKVVDKGRPPKSTHEDRKKAEDGAIRGFFVGRTDGAGDARMAGTTHELLVTVNAEPIVIKDQIQMYTTNQLVSHPLVSPVLQPSLGGLPPLLVMTGGGEIIRDEQIYLAHKAANPTDYPPSNTYLDDLADGRDAVSKWEPTDVQLQVWDDLCHVAPTLSFTRPAKYMYRSIAQFGAWALAKAQKTETDIQDGDHMSIISSGSDTDHPNNSEEPAQSRRTVADGVSQGGILFQDRIGKAGESLPPFKRHMIRQRVDRNGNIFPLDPESSLPALQLLPEEIGLPKPGPLRKWLKAKQEWDHKYAREKRRVQKQRAKEMTEGYQGFGNDEVPPPSALAGRRGLNMPKEKKPKRSWGMSLWSLWGSSHDQGTIEREEKAEKKPVTTVTVSEPNETGRAQAEATRDDSRLESRRRTVAYAGQDDEVEEDTPAAVIAQNKEEAEQNGHTTGSTYLAPPIIDPDDRAAEIDLSAPNYRPFAGGKAFPFKLRPQLSVDNRNASTITLISERVATPKVEEEGKQLGVGIAEDHPSTKGLAQGDKRLKLEDDEGVLHKGVLPVKPEHSTKQSPPSATHAIRAAMTGKAADKTRQTEAHSPVKDSALERRATMEDSGGVLHQGPRARPEQPIEQSPTRAAPAFGSATTGYSAIDAAPEQTIYSVRGFGAERRAALDHRSLPAKSDPATDKSHPNVADESSAADVTRASAAKDEAESSDDTMQCIGAVRRRTMEDRDGVLYSQGREPRRSRRG